MKSIIDLIYENDIFHVNDVERNGSDYKKMLDKICELEAELKRKYPEFKEKLGELAALQLDLTAVSNRRMFNMGVRAGAQIVLELIKPIK